MPLPGLDSGDQALGLEALLGLTRQGGWREGGADPSGPEEDA